MAVPKSKALKVLIEKFSQFQTKNMSVAKSRPFTVLVEGNIGCGKTTFLQHFAKVRQQMLNTRQQTETQDNRNRRHTIDKQHMTTDIYLSLPFLFDNTQLCSVWAC